MKVWQSGVFPGAYDEFGAMPWACDMHLIGVEDPAVRLLLLGEVLHGFWHNSALADRAALMGAFIFVCI